MGWFKRALNFYLESSMHVALAVTALTFMGYQAFELPANNSVLSFVFLGSITGYNLVKYAPVAGLFHRSLTRNLRAIQVFSFFVFLLLMFTFFKLPLVLKWMSIGLGMATLLYVIPFFGKKNFRNQYGWKIFIIAFVWAGVTTLLPYFTYHGTMSSDLWVTLAQRFLWVLVLTLPFDIRDLVYDSRELGTLPQRFGIEKTKVLGLIVLVAIVVLEGLKVNQNFAYHLSQLLILMVSGILLLFARSHQSRYYTTFWVEALPVFWLILYWALDYLFIS